MELIPDDYGPLLAQMRPGEEYTGKLLQAITGMNLAPVVYLLCKAAAAGRLERYNKTGISWVVYRKVREW